MKTKKAKMKKKTKNSNLLFESSIFDLKVFIVWKLEPAIDSNKIKYSASQFATVPMN